MPWQTYKDSESEKYCVHKKNADGSKGKKVACHDTEGEALAQMRALYVHAHSHVNQMNSAQLFGNIFRAIKHHDRDFLIVPGIPARAQVMNDYLVPAEEIGTFVQAWNGVPLTIQHPQQNNGSANVPAPDVSIIGNFYGADFDGQRMSGEYWIDVQKAQATQAGMKILENIKAGKMLETSTGYFAEEDRTPGVYEGKAYQLIHRHLRPDHIAILPDAIGACSLRDGCGVNRNQVKINQAPDYQKDCLPAAMLYGYSFNKGTRTQEQLDGLRAHITEKGIDKPVTIMRTDEGEIRILDGNHRVAMGHEMGVEQIPVKAYNADLQEIDPFILYSEWLHKQDQMYLHEQENACASCNCPYRNQAAARGDDNQKGNKVKESRMDTQELLETLRAKGWKITANEGGYDVQEPPPDEETDEEKKKKKAEEEAAAAATNEGGLTAAEVGALRQMAGMLPALQKTLSASANIAKAVKMAEQMEQNQAAEKNRLIASIKANASNQYTDEELQSFNVPVLIKTNAQMNVNFAGVVGGLDVYDNVEEALQVKPILLTPFESAEK